MPRVDAAILALALLLAAPAYADDDGVDMVGKAINREDITLNDQTIVASSRFTDSHISFNSLDRISLVGVQFEGSTYLTVDGKDYRDPISFEMLKLPKNVHLFGDVWMDSFGYPFEVGPQKICGFWEKLSDQISSRGKCDRD